MGIKSKNGFITVYVMIAMLFFIVFVTTATITGSKRLRLQEETNTALFEIYDKNIEGVLQENVEVIPIYTQQQFIKIANWLQNSNQEEYILINDTVYKLDPNKKGTYTFNLRTNVYLDGSVNTNDEDKDDYKYIANNIILGGDARATHTFLKDNVDQYDVENDNTNKIKTSRDYKIYIQYTDSTNDINDIVVHGKEIIEIRTALEFLHIGWNQDVNGVQFSSSARYEIKDNIQITQKDIDDFNEIHSEWWNKPEFTGELNGAGKIVDGLTMDMKNFTTDVGFFPEIGTRGVVENLTLTNVKIENTSNTDVIVNNMGIIAGSNSGVIQRCNILKSNRQIEKNYINGNGKIKPSTMIWDTERYMFRGDLGNIGGICGRNTNQILNCSINGLEIEKCNNAYSWFNIGLVVGKNSNQINGIEIASSGILIGSDESGNMATEGTTINGIGGVVGIMENEDNIGISIIENITINGLINLTDESASVEFAFGGIVGIIKSNYNRLNIININDNIIINVKNDRFVGGIVARGNNANISIENIKSNNDYGNININTNVDEESARRYYYAGIVAYCYGGTTMIQNCILNGGITLNSGDDVYIGSAIGYGTHNASQQCQIQNTYFNFNMDLNFNKNGGCKRVGGIVGYCNFENMTNSAYVGEITVTNSTSDDVIIGGMAGVVGDWQQTILNCLMNGILPEGEFVGALIGKKTSAHNFNLTNNYYNQAYRYIGINSPLDGVTNTSHPTTSDDLKTKIDTLKASIETAIANDIASGS